MVPPRGSSVQGISQARIQEWVAIPFSRRFSLSRAWTQVSCVAGRFFTIWAEAHFTKDDVQITTKTLKDAYFSLLLSGTLYSVGHVFPFLLCLLLFLFSQLFVRPPQRTTFPSWIFFFGIVLVTAFCTVLWTSVHSSSGTLLTRSSPLNLFIISTVNPFRFWFKSYLADLVFSPSFL